MMYRLALLTIAFPQRYTTYLKNLLWITLCLGIPTLASAQRYKTAFGLRVGDGMSLTLQQHVYKNWTVEGILHSGIGSRDVGLTVLGEKHQRIILRGINLYWGGGLHFYNHNGTDNIPDEQIAGVSGIAGGEISIGRINVSIDWKPELHFNGSDTFDWNGAALSVRYIIAKRKRKGIDDWDVWDKFKRKKKK